MGNTGVVIINGVKYRMVDRKAAVGERVIVTGERATFAIGKVFVVENVDWAYPAAGLRNGHNVIDGHYRVLEPLESAEAATTPEPLSAKPAPDQAAEIIAKLTTRVASLEKRVTMLEVANVKPIPRRTAKPAQHKSPQEIRDDIVKRAKEDVADLRKFKGTKIPNDFVHFWPRVDNPTEYLPMHAVEYVVNRDKRTVVALIRCTDDGHITRGIAKCAPGDVFNVWIGRAISLRRALGLEIPEEYVSAPQPTEIRVGDIAKIVANDGTHYYENGDVGRVIKRVDNGEKYATIIGTETNEAHRSRAGYQQHVVDADYVIIDDSRVDSAEPRKEVA